MIAWCAFQFKWIKRLVLCVSTSFYSSPKLWRGRLWEGSWTLQESYGDKRGRDFVDRWKSNFSTLIKWRYIQLKKRVITKHFPGTWTKVIKPAQIKGSLYYCFKADIKLLRKPIFPRLLYYFGTDTVFINDRETNV